MSERENKAQIWLKEIATVKFNVWEIKDGESIYQVWEA
jgi:hypothetical protein